MPPEWSRGLADPSRMDGISDSLERVFKSQKRGRDLTRDIRFLTLQILELSIFNLFFFLFFLSFVLKDIFLCSPGWP